MKTGTLASTRVLGYSAECGATETGDTPIFYRASLSLSSPSYRPSQITARNEEARRQRLHDTSGYRDCARIAWIADGHVTGWSGRTRGRVLTTEAQAISHCGWEGVNLPAAH